MSEENKTKSDTIRFQRMTSSDVPEKFRGIEIRHPQWRCDGCNHPILEEPKASDPCSQCGRLGTMKLHEWVWPAFAPATLEELKASYQDYEITVDDQSRMHGVRWILGAGAAKRGWDKNSAAHLLITPLAPRDPDRVDHGLHMPIRGERWKLTTAELVVRVMRVSEPRWSRGRFRPAKILYRFPEGEFRVLTVPTFAAMYQREDL